MITVAGEALIDLIVDPAGHIDPRPGGGPFNVARAVARLGQPATFLGRLSGDRFGRRLRAVLDQDGVLLAAQERAPADEPTTLAVADIDPAGVAAYRFYLTGTAAAALDRAALPAGTTALHIGTLGLVMEPVATALERLAATLPDDVLLMVDPNCRPSAVKDRRSYLARLDRIMRRADVVKASTDDLRYLGVRNLPVRCQLVTDGAKAVRVRVGDRESIAPVPAVEVVDTVGAGDAFGGAFLAWWIGNGLTREDLDQPDKAHEATLAAVEAAAVTCTRRGAEPPWAHELAGHAGWDWLGHKLVDLPG